MKIEKFKTENATSALGQAAGVAAGAMLSSGVSGVIPIKNKLAVKGIVAVTGVALATMVGGKDTAAAAIKSIGVGMAAQQAKEMISDVVSPMLPSKPGKLNQFLRDAVGAKPAVAPEAMSGVLAARLARARMGNPDQYRMANPLLEGSFAAI